jgi:hypothetical protein
MKHSKQISKRNGNKDPNVYPAGWNAKRVERVIKYYDRMKDRPVLDSAEVASIGRIVWMDIPQDLVPDVLRLIKRKRKTA